MNKRKVDISEMLLKMGNALTIEGEQNEDETIASIGSYITLLSGVVLDENDTYEFGVLCSMFSAKKILELNQTNIPPMDVNEIIKNLRKLRGDSDK